MMSRRMEQLRRLAPRQQRTGGGALAVNPDDFQRDDAEANAATAPPPAEEIRLRGIWVAECYPVSQVGSLALRLQALAPANPRPLSLITGALNTLETSRTGPSRGGSANLGVLVPPGSTAFAHADRLEVDLPPSTEYAFAWIVATVSSMPILIVQCFIRESEMRRVEHVLRQEYSTYTEPHGHWTSIVSPANQKRDAAVAARAETVREVIEWITCTFPGFFASGSLDGSFPVLEFWTLEQRRPFADPPQDQPRVPLHGDYVELLGWGRTFDAWRSTAAPGAVLAPIDRWGMTTEERFALQLVAKTPDLFAGEDMQSYGGFNSYGYMNRLHHLGNDLIAGWALRSALRGYEIQFAELREQLLLAGRRQLFASRRADRLAAAELTLLRLRSDVEPMIAQLRASSVSDSPASHDFIASRPGRDEQSRGWMQTDEEVAVWFADRLRETVRELTEVSTAIVGVLTAQVNLRLQRHVRMLTFVAVAVAVLALILQLRS